MNRGAAITEKAADEASLIGLGLWCDHAVIAAKCIKS
jgi:hypothetical protein